MHKLYSCVFGFLLLLIVTEQVLVSLEVFNLSELVEEKLESDNTDEREEDKEDELYARINCEFTSAFLISSTSTLESKFFIEFKSLGKTFSNAIEPPYSPPDFK